MLNILERYDLKADGRDSPRTLHRVTEAMRRAFFIRATQLADPDFVAVPVAELTSKSYADELARSIGERATPSAELAPFPILAAEGDHTTHLSTIDAGRQRRGADLHAGGIVRRQVRGRRARASCSTTRWATST